MKRSYVSPAVIRRLPRYYRYLDDLSRAGAKRISSSALGRDLGLTASQIRQDLSCFGEFGQQGYGYNVENLRQQIAQILGMDQGHTAIVMGVGNLGRALLENFHFSWNGFQLYAGFDLQPDVVGSEIAGVPILHASRLEEFVSAHPVSVGVLTVTQEAAAAAAERLSRVGVRGIWNFTNTELNLSDSSVVVENVHFSDSLLALSYMISEDRP